MTPLFTEPERTFLLGARLARIATASAIGVPDVAAVTFVVDRDTIVTGGYDITRTVRYRNLLANPLATIVIDDLASVEPWRPRGVKVRGSASIEEHRSGLKIRIVPQVVWSWGLDPETVGVHRRDV